MSAPEVVALTAGARELLAVLALAGIGLMLWSRRPGVLLAFAVAANAWAWGVTSLPLGRLYALTPASDRMRNLAMCQVAVAGNSPFETMQIGQPNFEPFWSVVLTLLAAGEPARTLAIYPYLPLLMLTAFCVVLYFGLRPAPGEPDSPWERGLATLSATLLASAPFDFAGVYRVPWAMTFLLKPNHALGLVLVPVVLSVVARARGPRGRLAAGLLLAVLGWAFVLHMFYVALGLGIHALLAWREGRARVLREGLEASLVVGVALLLTTPYMLMLLSSFPLRQGTLLSIPASSAHLLEPSTRAGWVFLLGLWGARTLASRGRLGRLWTAQWLGGWLLWLAYVPLSAMSAGKERDDVFYWLRFLTALLAGVGAWDLAGRAAGSLASWLRPPERRAAALSLVALPFALPAWWDPPRMDLYFASALEPVPSLVRDAAAFLRDRTDPRAVVAGDHAFAPWVAGFAGRRVLLYGAMHKPEEEPLRLELEGLLLSGADPRRAAELAARWNVRYLSVTPALVAERPGLSLAALDSREDLQRVYLGRAKGGDFVAIYELRTSL